MPAQSAVFLPGFMCDERLFMPQIQTLSRAGVACAFADLTQACSIERMAEQVLKIAPKKFAAIGLSMGGIVALELYRQAPGRITHLALLNTTARADAAGIARKKQLGRVAAGELDLVLREELKPQYLAPINRTDDRLQILESMGVGLGEDVFCRQTMALTIRRSYLEQVDQIHCPTLLLAGAEDTVCPVDRHREIADRIAQAKLTVIDACGHISTLEQPDIVSAALLDLLEHAPAHTTKSGNCALKLVKKSN
ncbi:MAG: alpha/beta hydrolase [Pseudomonadota bacterium]